MYFQFESLRQSGVRVVHVDVYVLSAYLAADNKKLTVQR